MSAVFNFTFVPWFRSVAPYIHKFRNQTFVIGLFGEGIAAGKLHNIAQDLALIQARLEPFRREGLLNAEAGRVEVVGRGRLVIRSICAAVDAYFDAQQGRHAKAL